MGSKKARESPCECAEILQIVTDIKKRLDSCYKLIKEQNLKIDSLQTEIIELKEQDKNCVENNVKSYSDVAKSKSEHILLVKPRNEQTANKVKEDLKNNIKPEDLQIGINIGKNVRNGGVIVKCADGDALNTAKENIEKKMGEHYDVNIPKKVNPKIIVVGIYEEEKNETDLPSKIIKQNKIVQNKNFLFKILHKTKTKNGKFNLIIETDPETFSVLLPNELESTLHVGWKNCNVYEYFSVKRCYLCWGFNHEAKDCKEKIACPVCAGGHKSDKCKSGVVKCVNCLRANEKLNLNLDTNHSCFDRKCSCYLKNVDSVKKKTAYEK